MTEARSTDLEVERLEPSSSSMAQSNTATSTAMASKRPPCRSSAKACRPAARFSSTDSTAASFPYWARSARPNPFRPNTFGPSSTTPRHASIPGGSRSSRCGTSRATTTSAVEHVGAATFFTSVFVCRTFGTIVICGATSGFQLDFDVRYLWMRQKSILGSHFANAYECQRANQLIATVVGVTYLTPDDQVGDPPPDAVPEGGDTFRLEFVFPNLLKATTLHSSNPDHLNLLGNPYFCRDGLAREVSFACGA